MEMATTISDLAYSSFIGILLFLIISALLLQGYYTSKKSTKSSSASHFHLPPSPPSIPLIGHMHYLTPKIYKCFHDLSTKYGPLLYLRLGYYPLLLVSSASTVTEIFKTNDLNFSSRPKSPMEDRLVFGNDGFIAAPYGDYYKFMKKFCMTELLGTSQLERSRKVRREELVRFLQKMFERAHDENEVVDVSWEVHTLSYNSVCRMMMSRRYPLEDNEVEKWRVLVKETFEFATNLGILSMLGPFKKLGSWICGKRTFDVHERFDELLEKLLKEREDDGERKDKDLLDILLELYQDREAVVKITRNQMKAFFLDLLVAGVSASADAMEWVMAELINHPNVYKKVREEIQSVVGKNNRLVEESDIPSLHYLQAVVKEALRLHPPAPATPRACHEDCKILGFDVPQGTTVMLNLYSIMRDPETWENPDDFLPERFLAGNQENDEEDISNNDMSKGQSCFNFVAFGGGRRTCLGVHLASRFMNVSIAAMVQCFDWKVIAYEDHRDGNEAKVNMQPKSGFVMSLAHPILCRPVIHFNPFTVAHSLTNN